MATLIRPYTLQEFCIEYLAAQHPRYGIRATVLHHTYRPRGRDYRGIETIRGIQRYHMQTRGWSDIGANAYAAPDGMIYNGRPLSASNYAHANISRSWSKVPDDLRALADGNRQFLNHHGFGIETIGDFGEEDPATSIAMATALDVLAAVHRLYNLPAERMFLHRDAADKSCPGSLVSRSWAREQLAARLEDRPTVLPQLFGPDGVEIECGLRVDADTARADVRSLVAALGFATDASNYPIIQLRRVAP